MELTRDLCDDRHDIRAIKPIDRGNYLGIGGKGTRQLLEEHLIERLPEGVCFRVWVFGESLCKSIVELPTHLGERKQPFGEVGGGSSEKASASRGMKSDAKGMNQPLVIQAKGF